MFCFSISLKTCVKMQSFRSKYAIQSGNALFHMHRFGSSCTKYTCISTNNIFCFYFLFSSSIYPYTRANTIKSNHRTIQIIKLMTSHQKCCSMQLSIRANLGKVTHHIKGPSRTSFNYRTINFRSINFTDRWLGCIFLYTGGACRIRNASCPVGALII